MHISLLNDDILPESQGGAAVVVDRLKRAYEAKGHNVTLISSHQNAAKGEIAREEGRVSILSCYPPVQRHRTCLGTSEMSGRLTQVFEELRPDAVHIHNIHAHLTYESLRIAKQHTPHTVLTAHDVFLVAFARLVGSRFEKLMLEGKPVHLHWWEHFLSTGRKYWPLRNARIRKMLLQTKVPVVAISNAHKKFLEANGVHVSSVIYNGTEVHVPVSLKKIDAFRSTHGLTGPTVLFGGRLSADKGSAVLLSTFEQVLEQCSDAQLLIVGDKRRMEDELRDVSESVRSACVFPGWLSPDVMRVAYAASTVVTTPSLCFEPFGLMNIEAMAEGTPVIASPFGGAPEIINDGETGFIVNPRDTKLYADAMIQLLSNPKEAARMGE
ncbi:MAG: glycosyltransferase family 4 protein, partial [Candidatus Peregrinibacteria bacterium]|nr:glycosyltransferase family 4 protein [Candidatus Peregrinibacteria bacterium]